MSAIEYAVIDVETTPIADGEIPRTKFWGYADSKGYERFKTTAELQRFLKGSEERYLLHHANFDVIQALVDGARDIHILKSHNGKLIRSLWDKHTVTNTFSVFPVSLASIMEAFNYRKTSLRNLEKRNYEDCVNGLECFLALDEIFCNLTGVSPLAKGTIAATGLAVAEKLAGRLPKDLRFLSAYRGGRVEVFDTNYFPDSVSNFDIASSYPFAFIDAPREDWLCEVEVKSKDWHGPLFDARNEEMLVFPNGVFRSWVFLSNWERYIEPYCEHTRITIKARHKIELHWLHRLHDFIADIFKRKAESTGAIRLVCKFLLNSLYGRIGLKGESERVRILTYRPDGDDVTIYFLRKGQYLVFDTVTREPRSNYGIAAFITDNARARLFRAFKQNKAIYGDTDSVFTKRANSGANHFSGTQGKKIGQWEHQGTSWFKAHNLKDYEHGCYACNGKGCKKCHNSGVVFVRKGGDEHIVWTLKKFAARETAERVIRTRQSTLQKRALLPDGTTTPLTITRQ